MAVSPEEAKKEAQEIEKQEEELEEEVAEEEKDVEQKEKKAEEMEKKIEQEEKQIEKEEEEGAIDQAADDEETVIKQEFGVVKLVDQIIREMEDEIRKEIEDEGYIETEEELSFTELKDAYRKLYAIDQEIENALMGKDFENIDVKDFRALEEVIQEIKIAAQMEEKAGEHMLRVYKELEEAIEEEKELEKIMEHEEKETQILEKESQFGANIAKKMRDKRALKEEITEEKQEKELEQEEKKQEQALKKVQKGLKEAKKDLEEDLSIEKSWEEVFKKDLEIMTAVDKDLRQMEQFFDGRNNEMERAVDRTRKDLEEAIQTTENIVEKAQKIENKIL